MTKDNCYIATDAKSRFNNRDVRRVRADGKKSSPEKTRVFVPFSGFDGQSLAGSGALVWEGEILSTSRH